MKKFESINKAYNEIFQPQRLSIGIVSPIESYPHSSVPSMDDHVSRVQMVESLGFKAVWVRDVPFHVPTFGDAGQMYDPFTYLGFLAAHTSEIALCTGSIALPLHHPLHVAKSAHTIDQLSNGRLVLGVASGDRPSEYPAMQFDFENRGEAFRNAFDYIRTSNRSFPVHSNDRYGVMNGSLDLLPKSFGSKIPMLITGHSRQTDQWIAENGDGWIYYPRNFYMQEHNIKQWRSLIPESHGFDKPFMQSLYIDLQDDPEFKPQHIHLGFRIGINYLIEYFKKIEELGVNHVCINLKLNSSPIEWTLKTLGEKVLPIIHND